MGRYLFRADCKYKNGENIDCANKKSRIKLPQFIINGSDSKRKTKFISTTKEILVAARKFAIGRENEENIKRSPVVLIDFEKIPKEVKYYDLTDKDVREAELKSYPGAQTLVKSDREVVFEYQIPAKCCKQIPPIIVDILCAFQMCNKGKVSEQYNIIGDCICDMVMNGEEGKIEQIVQKMNLNQLEKDFIKIYYDNQKTIKQTGKELFGNVSESEKENSLRADCIRVQLIKNIVHREEFIKVLGGQIAKKWETIMKENKTEGDNVITKEIVEKDSYLKTAIFLNNQLNSKDMIEDYIELPEKGIGTTSQDKKEKKHIFGKCLYIKSDEDNISIPYGMEYKMEGKNILLAEPKKAYLTRNEDGILLNLAGKIRGFLGEKFRVEMKDKTKLDVTDIGEKALANTNISEIESTLGNNETKRNRKAEEKKGENGDDEQGDDEK